MNLKYVLITGMFALALAACGNQPATQSPTAAAGDSSGTAATSGTTTAPIGTTAPAGDSGATSTDPSADVVRVGDLSISRGEMDARVKRIQDAISAQGAADQVPPALDIEKSLVDLFLNEVLTLNVANSRSVSVSDADVDAELKRIEESIVQSGGTLEQAITGQLGYESVTTPDFRMLISSIVARQKIAETLVTSDTVETELRADLEEQAKEEVKKADVRHILVATEEEATAVITRLDAGETFEDLAKELSTDPGSKDNGGLYEGIEPGQFVPEFDKAMFEDLQPGETTKAGVKTDFGYHVIRLEKLSNGPRFTPEQIEQQIVEQAPSVLDQRRQEEFQKLVDAEKEKGLADGTVVEPTYPEPTPEAPGALPQDLQPATTPEAPTTTP
ncbi:MAG: peptidylprolyl isomerase [Roseiflexaceae bacterium]|nr:peptidylprolyl isomerase [Roseiflexaceae bacterium]